jgi:hypothetical protein
MSDDSREYFQIIIKEYIFKSRFWSAFPSHISGAYFLVIILDHISKSQL